VVVIVNGDETEIDDGSTVTAMIDQLGLGKRVLIVERNGDPVPRAAQPTTVLRAGDRIELVRAVAGG
jgi:sulfur carrier protein